MPLTVTKDSTTNTITLRISGRFVFDVQREFRDAYREEPPGPSYVIDLMETDYMDSSALGMLLMLWEHVKQDRSKMIIINANGAAREILALANFEKYLEIK